MDSGNDSSNSDTEDGEKKSESDLNTLDDKQLTQIIDDYRSLLDTQSSERKRLLDQVDKIYKKTDGFTSIDNKLENLVGLLKDLRQQIQGLSAVKKSNVPLSQPILENSEVIVSTTEMKNFSKLIHNKLFGFHN